MISANPEPSRQTEDAQSRRLQRLVRRITAIWKRRRAMMTGKPEHIVMGRLGYRRVMHFWPDGKTEIHSGSTCICDVIYILDTLRFAPYDDSPNDVAHLPPR